MKSFIIILTSIGLLFGCTKNSEVAIKKIIVSSDGLTSQDVIADTIVYSVDIVNYDATDEWSTWRLRHLKTSHFVDEVFKNVYSGKLRAYDYFTDKPLTPEEVRKIEESPDYLRSNIEEIQFEEIWLFSVDEQKFHKEVYSFVLAYALYADGGYRRGLKPALRVRLKD